MDPETEQPPQTDDADPLILQVYRAEDLRVTNGVNQDEPLGFAAELLPDDVYSLTPGARPGALRIAPGDVPPYRIAPGSAEGRPGATLHLDCCATFMSPDGQTTECLVLVETDEADHVARIHVMPLAAMRPRTDYTLIGTDRDTARLRFAQVACTSFTRGTAITLATGEQRAVEDLRIGDIVLTRDSGPQPVRWIGQITMRAVGVFAPIRIRARALNNSGDLLVGPEHRLFIYQRRYRLGAGRAEVMVRARHLVDGDAIRRQPGGFVDYFQLLLDRHEILYAEGIAAESMRIDPRTRLALPAAVQEDVESLLPQHRESASHDLEVARELLRRPDAAALLRKSSSG